MKETGLTNFRCLKEFSKKKKAKIESNLFPNFGPSVLCRKKRLTPIELKHPLEINQSGAGTKNCTGFLDTLSQHAVVQSLTGEARHAIPT